MDIREISCRTPEIIEKLTVLWEKSVRATHVFLTDRNIAEIRNYIPGLLLDIKHLIIIEDHNNTVAFLGIEGNRVEMLFVSPDRLGQGLGRTLLIYGMDKYAVDTVCVNEQNPDARKFYERMGFKVYERTRYDEQGAPFPLLYMKLTL